MLHSREDAVVPMSDGIELASGIAGARFVPLDSQNHLPSPASRRGGGSPARIEGFLAEQTLS